MGFYSVAGFAGFPCAVLAYLQTAPHSMSSWTRFRKTHLAPYKGLELGLFSAGK